MTSISVSVTASYDDAIENASTGSIVRTSNNEVSATYGYNGLRFELPIPQGSIITSATLTVVVNNSTIDIPDIDIYCQAADNAGAFNVAAYDISGRDLTTNKRQWIVASPGVGSGTRTSPDLSAPLQEVINRPGYVKDNGVVFILVNRGSSDFRFQSYDTGTAPQLDVTYVAAAVKVDLDTVTLTGTAVSLTVIPGGVSITPQTITALFDVLNISPSVDNVDQTINLAEIIAHLQAESVTLVPGPVALLLDVLTAALATQPLDVTLGAFDVFLQMQRAQLSAALSSLAVVPGTAVVRLDTIGMTVTLDGLLLFLMLACVNVRDRARFEATVDNALRYHVTVSDRTGCE